MDCCGRHPATLLLSFSFLSHLDMSDPNADAPLDTFRPILTQMSLNWYNRSATNGSCKYHIHIYGSASLPRQRDRFFIAEDPAPAPHLAYPEGCAALRIVLVTVPRVRYPATLNQTIFISRTK